MDLKQLMKRGLVKVDCWSFRMLAKMEESQREICFDEVLVDGGEENVMEEMGGGSGGGGGKDIIMRGEQEDGLAAAALDTGRKDWERRRGEGVGSSSRLWAMEK